MSNIKNRMYKRLVLSISVMIVVFIKLYPLTFITNDYTCPIDSTSFSYEVDASGSSRDTRLDLKRIGAIAQPRELPQCPNCKFVLFKEVFDKNELLKLKPYILSEEYQNISEENSSYYYLAKIKEYQKESNFDIGITYLEASWQVEWIADLYAKYSELSLINFEKAAIKLFNIENENDDYLLSMYMQVELNRKFGNFDDAQKIIADFPDLTSCSIDWLPEILDFQDELIKNEDFTNHSFSELIKDKTKETLPIRFRYNVSYVMLILALIIISLFIIKSRRGKEK